MIALVSSPCIAPGTIPCGIALLKRGLAQAGVSARCFFLANAYEQQILVNPPDLYEILGMASEVGYDYQNPYFAGIVFGHETPEILVRASIERNLSGRAGTPKTLDDLGLSKRRLRALARDEVESAIQFCSHLRAFCKDQVDEILAFHPALVGFSCYSSQLFTSVFMAKLIKVKRKGVRTVLGGGAMTRADIATYASHLPHIDAFVAGRDAAGICELLDRVSHTENEPARRTYAFGARDSEGTQEYLEPDFTDAKSLLWHPRRPSVSMPLSNSEGCRWGRCRFCTASRASGADVLWNPPHVAETVTRLARDEGVAGFAFAEWEVNSDPARLSDFCERLASAKLRLDLWGEFSPANCTRELFTKMASVGRWSIQLGVESFSDDLLKLMRKRQRSVDNILAVRLALEEGIAVVHFNLIYGFPAESATHIRETRSLLRRISHLLSDSRVIVDLVPYSRVRRPGENGRGIAAETQYLPNALRDSFPTQCLPQRRNSRHLRLWRDVQQEIENLDPCCLCAFDIGTRVIIDDMDGQGRTVVLEGVDAAVLRCLLDKVCTRRQLASELSVSERDVSRSLGLLVAADVVWKSGSRYVALPIRS